MCHSVLSVQRSIVGKMKGQLQQLDSDPSPSTSESVPSEGKATKRLNNKACVMRIHSYTCGFESHLR